jgi:two-component system cell cycle sensor histidine kinase/response regulator CckA
MDDEEMIRDIAKTMLTHLGYTVTTCTKGEESIALYRESLESKTPFWAVIVDLTIPGGLGGMQAAEDILAMSPAACLIVSSGYSNDPIMANCRKYGFSAAITKPYSIGEFEQVLNSLPVH